MVHENIVDLVDTHEGGVGFQRTPKEELFLAAVTSFNEDTFYEAADERVQRIQELTKHPDTINDPEWTLNFVRWLRHVTGLRSIPAVVAVSAVGARLNKGLINNNRQIIKAAVGRLDECSSVLETWMSLYGRRIPSCVKRGVADALNTYLSEVSYLKWSGRINRSAITLRDVINLTHPQPKQEALIKYVLDNSYGKKGDDTQLPIISARRKFLSLNRDKQICLLTGPDARKVICEAALTHEVVAGAIGQITGKVWEVLVPDMGYTALRMNLRRIAQSNPSQDLINMVNMRLCEPDKYTLPVSLYSAYKNVPLVFVCALENAANTCLENIPALKGRTLVLLDRSYSMSSRLSTRSGITYQDVANVFAAALSLRGEDVRVVAFDDYTQEVHIDSKDLLRIVERMPYPRGGTSTANAIIDAHKEGEMYERIVILTDEQNDDGSVDYVLDKFAPGVPVFTWSLVGYKAAHTSSRYNRWTFGGLSDKGFQIIPLLEACGKRSWPWE
nr:MAG TPA: ribonucleoprotein [Caudoviricetes sp.]